MEKTLIILKPSIPEECKKEVLTSQNHFQKIFERIIQLKGFNIEKRKEGLINKKTAEEHYDEKKDHPLFNDVIKYITSDVSIILSITGETAILEVRKIVLAMRKKYLKTDSKLYNLIHASDSEYESSREHEIHFGN